MHIINQNQKKNKFIFSKIIKYLHNPIDYFLYMLCILVNKLFSKYYTNYCKNFFKKKKLLNFFTDPAFTPDKIKPDFIDLKRIYDLVLKRKPKCILEFGSGFSTIAFALAARENEVNHNIPTKIFSVEADINWFKNNLKSFPQELKKYVNISFSKNKIICHTNQIATIHEIVPNISPNLIYLDGPGPENVDGNFNNLSFKSTIYYNKNNSIFYKQNARSIVSADPLMFESTAPNDFFILIDGRYHSVDFLEKNLKYCYKIKKSHYFNGHTTFEKKNNLFY
jgi:hypothetical protein